MTSRTALYINFWSQTLFIGKLIMFKLTSLASLLLAGFLLAGCSSSNEDEFADVATQELFDKGQSYLQKEDYNNAIRYLEAADGRNRQGSYAESIQLGLIYANYKISEYYKALDNAERFARVFPDSSSIDYVYYLAALSNARLSDNFMQDLFGINSADRAAEMVRNAYGSFQTLVRNYPQSRYVEDANKWLVYLKNRMAEHDLKIVKFYMKRDAYVAVANRVQEMLRIHPEAQATHEALPLLKEAFTQMGIHDSAEKVATMIEANSSKTFPKISKPAYGDQF